MQNRHKKLSDSEVITGNPFHPALKDLPGMLYPHLSGTCFHVIIYSERKEDEVSRLIRCWQAQMFN